MERTDKQAVRKVFKGRACLAIVSVDDVACAFGTRGDNSSIQALPTRTARRRMQWRA